MPGLSRQLSHGQRSHVGRKPAPARRHALRRPPARVTLFALAAVLAALFAPVFAACKREPPPRPSTAPGAARAAEHSGNADEPSAADPSGLPKVVFLGDSIAAGLHLPQDESFPALLAERLREHGQPFALINAGVSGDTTAGGLRRIDWLLKQRPALVVIELGGNDGLRGVALSEIERNLRGIVDKVRAAGATPLLLGVRLPPSYGAPYATGFDAIYPRLARELELPFVPFFMEGVAGVDALNLDDGLHPTAQGHARLADNVEPSLRALLAR